MLGIGEERKERNIAKRNIHPMTGKRGEARA